MKTQYILTIAIALSGLLGFHGLNAMSDMGMGRTGEEKVKRHVHHHSHNHKHQHHYGPHEHHHHYYSE